MTTTSPPNATAADLVASATRSLPRDVIDALQDLYTEQQRRQWLERYTLTCRRKRRAMIFFALKDAGYPTG